MSLGHGSGVEVRNKRERPRKSFQEALRVIAVLVVKRLDITPRLRLEREPFVGQRFLEFREEQRYVATDLCIPHGLDLEDLVHTTFPHQGLVHQFQVIGGQEENLVLQRKETTDMPKRPTRPPTTGLAFEYSPNKVQSSVRNPIRPP